MLAWTCVLGFWLLGFYLFLFVILKKLINVWSYVSHEANVEKTLNKAKMAGMWWMWGHCVIQLVWMEKNK